MPPEIYEPEDDDLILPPSWDLPGYTRCHMAKTIGKKTAAGKTAKRKTAKTGGKAK